MEKIQKKCPDLNPEWLLFGQGAMLKTGAETPSLTQPTASLTSETLLLDLLQRVQRLERQVDLLQEKTGVSADAGTPGNVTGTYGI